jgi:hypothetical protein
MEVTHPVNDESLASYHRPELLALLPGLELALDCWNLLDTNGRGSEKAKYLHKESGEPKSAYEERLHRSTYTPIFRDSIRAYAGLLSRFQLVDVPQSMLTAEQNVDMQGSSIQSFWNSCDELAIRDGGVFVMVDMPPSDGETNYIDEMRNGRTPYLIQVERSNVINWSVEYVKGRELVKHVTVRQIRSKPQREGYGTVIEPIYLVMRPGSVETVRLEKIDSRWIQVSEGVIPTSLPVIPIKWYGASNPKFAQGDLPMNGLAELSIQHYQMRSDLQELLHKCAMPVPVRKGAPIGANGRPVPLIIGPNTAVDLQDNGGFEFAEPTGRSLERHQGEIVHVEALMDRSGLNFLYGANIKTATEASLRASQISSQISSLIRNKASSFFGVMLLWAAYAGELSNLNPESGIAINDSLINRPIDPNGIAQMINLYKVGLLSRRTVLDELQRGGILDPDMKIEAELQRIDDEQSQGQDSSGQPGDAVGKPGSSATGAAGQPGG